MEKLTSFAALLSFRDILWNDIFRFQKGLQRVNRFDMNYRDSSLKKWSESKGEHEGIQDNTNKLTNAVACSCSKQTTLNRRMIYSCSSMIELSSLLSFVVHFTMV